jgi:hypothetical protein
LSASASNSGTATLAACPLFFLVIFHKDAGRPICDIHLDVSVSKDARTGGRPATAQGLIAKSNDPNGVARADMAGAPQSRIPARHPRGLPGRHRSAAASAAADLCSHAGPGWIPAADPDGLRRDGATDFLQRADDTSLGAGRRSRNLREFGELLLQLRDRYRSDY